MGGCYSIDDLYDFPDLVLFIIFEYVDRRTCEHICDICKKSDDFKKETDYVYSYIYDCEKKSKVRKLHVKWDDFMDLSLFTNLTKLDIDIEDVVHGSVIDLYTSPHISSISLDFSEYVGDKIEIKNIPSVYDISFAYEDELVLDMILPISIVEIREIRLSAFVGIKNRKELVNLKKITINWDIDIEENIFPDLDELSIVILDRDVLTSTLPKVGKLSITLDEKHGIVCDSDFKVRHIEFLEFNDEREFPMEILKTAEIIEFSSSAGNDVPIADKFILPNIHTIITHYCVAPVINARVPTTVKKIIAEPAVSFELRLLKRPGLEIEILDN